MSMILKQETEGSIPAPSTGKGTIYINTSGELAVKKPDGTGGQTAFAAVANSVSVSNVAGIGNVALLNLTGSSTNVLYGNGVFAPAAGGGSYGNSNVATFLASFGSNTITTSGVISSTGNVNGGNINAGNMFVDGIAYLGAVGNITITGGSAGQVLRTNGSGALSWVNQSGGGGGSPGGSDTQLQFNDAGSFGGISGATYDGANLTIDTVTIGNVYYSDNIVSPIPTYANTAYGNVLVNTPFVVNSPLNVLSGDATDTTFLTLSGSILSGYQSGGTNNSGYISNNVVQFSLYSDGADTTLSTALSTIRIGDVVTCIGTNGLFTGSVTFTVTQVVIIPPNSSGSTQGSMKLLGIPASGTTVTSFNANIITVVRPYTPSSILGQTTIDVVNTTELVVDEVVVNSTLNVTKNLYLGAAQNVAAGIQTVNVSYFGPTTVYPDCRITNFISYYMYGGNSSNPFQGFQNILMYQPAVTISSRTIQFLLDWQTSGIPISISTTVPISFMYLDGTNGISNYTLYWKDGTAPTVSVAGRMLITYEFIYGSFILGSWANYS